MFHSARLKLTAFYLVIIAAITLTFSFVIYEVLAAELNRVERMQRLRNETRNLEMVEKGGGRWPPPPTATASVGRPPYLDPTLITETKQRIIFYLSAIDISIILSSGVAGYFLAGYTLLPIQQMWEKQKRFVSDAAHELRTPLAIIKAENEVGLRDKHFNLATAQQLVKSNLEEVDRLQTLTNSLLQLSRWEGGRSPITREPVTIMTVWQKARLEVEKFSRVHRISIILVDCPAVVIGDITLLTELFVILLDNAVKYSPPHTCVTLSGKKTDGHWRLQITDHGQGIAAADLPHIFDRFYRANTARNQDDTAGYGLGLAIAQEIVQLHHGQLTVTSKPGKGSTFTVVLPTQ